MTFEYILIKVNKDRKQINIVSNYNFFQQTIPTIYETYIHDYSSRRWLGVPNHGSINLIILHNHGIYIQTKLN